MLQNYYFYICIVLHYLQKTGLQANIDKCKFYIQKIKFLNFIIFTKNIQKDLQKVITICNWV